MAKIFKKTLMVCNFENNRYFAFFTFEHDLGFVKVITKESLRRQQRAIFN